MRSNEKGDFTNGGFYWWRDGLGRPRSRISLLICLLLGICFWREGLEGAFGPEQRGVKGGGGEVGFS